MCRSRLCSRLNLARAEAYRISTLSHSTRLPNLRRYFESKCQYTDLLVPMLPPGRTMLLRRLKEPRTGQQGQPAGRGQQQQHRQRRGRRRSSWDAVWIQPEQIVEEGILLSR
jgi:hypothetical protein